MNAISLEVKCPHCGAPFHVEVMVKDLVASVKETSSRDGYIFNSLLAYLSGVTPTYQGYFRPVENESSSWQFKLKLYDSPEGDSWASGVISWKPGLPPQIEIKKHTRY